MFVLTIYKWLYILVQSFWSKNVSSFTAMFVKPLQPDKDGRFECVHISSMIILLMYSEIVVILLE